MAKKRAKPGPKPAPRERQRLEIVAIRCTPAWKEWLLKFADHKRTTPTSILDQGAAMLAAEAGFEPPPKR